MHVHSHIYQPDPQLDLVNVTARSQNENITSNGMIKHAKYIVSTEITN